MDIVGAVTASVGLCRGVRGLQRFRRGVKERLPGSAGGLPDPHGVDRADEWQDDALLPYRALLGAVRGTDGLDIDLVCVQPTAIQFSDGRIDDGSVHEPPHVYLRDDALSTSQARQLAAVLIEVSDEIDRLSSDS
jgi:hypothetical protein